MDLPKCSECGFKVWPLEDLPMNVTQWVQQCELCGNYVQMQRFPDESTCSREPRHENAGELGRVDC